MKIAVDFDGTLCVHEFPSIGKDLGGCEVIRALQAKGHKVYLYTMRSGRTLQEAIAWCKLRGVVFDSINTDPGQRNWTSSPKCHANLYIDDASLGVPLVDGHLDWFRVVDELMHRHIFTKQESEELRHELTRFL